jgi:hypothetical protein
VKDCQDNRIQNAFDIPYFDGDFWPNIIEQSIKGLVLLLIIKIEFYLIIF